MYLSVLNHKPCVHSGYRAVLILIVMDVPLGDCAANQKVTYTMVLILIVMDVPLGDPIMGGREFTARVS